MYGKIIRYFPHLSKSCWKNFKRSCNWLFLCLLKRCPQFGIIPASNAPFRKKMLTRQEIRFGNSYQVLVDDMSPKSPKSSPAVMAVCSVVTLRNLNHNLFQNKKCHAIPNFLHGISCFSILSYRIKKLRGMRTAVYKVDVTMRPPQARVSQKHFFVKNL